MKTAVVDGVTIAYRDSGQGKPIVFIHGLASCAVSWAGVTTILSRKFRTISLDLMGSGSSDKPLNESYTLERQAQLLRLFLMELEIENAVLVGHSYGGGVCLTAVHDSCPQVEALVLVDSICYPQSLPLSFRLLRLPVLGPLALWCVPKSWITGTVLINAYGRKMRPPEELIRANAEILSSAQGRHAFVRTIRELVSRVPEQLIDYSRLALPTLIIWGSRDRLVPFELGKRLARDIPGAQLTSFDDCGHLPQEEDPDATARVIQHFICQLGK